MTNKISLASLAALLMIFGSLSAKEKPPVTEAWTGAGLEYDISKKLEAALDYENRVQTDGGKSATNLYDFGLSYDLTKQLESGFVMRFKDKPSGMLYEFKPYVSYKYKFSDFAVKTRIMYENEFQNGNSPDHYFRFRTGLSYNISKKLEAEVKTEYFYHFSYDRGDRFNKNRSTVELSYEIAKPLEISAFWMYQNEMNERKMQDSRVWGLHLYYKLN